MSRSVIEWIGRTDKSKVPDRVRIRVFERHGNKCYLTGREIRPSDKWEIEHVVSLIPWDAVILRMEKNTEGMDL
jgi:hypothetical protein